MTTCSQLHASIDAYIDEALSEDEKHDLDEHLTNCNQCSRHLQQAKSVADSLAAMREVPESVLSTKQETEIWNAVWTQNANRARPNHHFLKGFLAASVLASLAFFHQHLQLSSNEEVTKSVAFELLETKQIHLMFSSEKNEDLAVFTIEIPEHFEYPGRAMQRQITWKAPLVKGKNLLTIPLAAKTPTTGVLKAHVTIGPKTQTFEVQLNTQPNV